MEERKKLEEKSEIGLDDLEEDNDAEDNRIADMTLSEYFARFNSEDNRSFEDLIEDDKKRWRKKFWWIFKQEKDARNEQKALMDSSNSGKLNNMIEGNRENKFMLTNYETKNNFMFNPKAPRKKFTELDEDDRAKKQTMFENTRIEEPVDDTERSVSSKFDNRDY
mmetsp:Transcript_9933/g.8461  ORF Transcript_9933/g.8461 Transcript_9933/m.8461 type:complete len:165 (+) Transcript_9933:236-730(+)